MTPTSRRARAPPPRSASAARPTPGITFVVAQLVVVGAGDGARWSCHTVHSMKTLMQYVRFNSFVLLNVMARFCPVMPLMRQGARLPLDRLIVNESCDDEY